MKSIFINMKNLGSIFSYTLPPKQSLQYWGCSGMNFLPQGMCRVWSSLVQPLNSATLTPSWVLRGYESQGKQELDLNLSVRGLPQAPAAPQIKPHFLTLYFLEPLPPSFRRKDQRRFQLSESDVEVNENTKVVLWNKSHTGWVPTLKIIKNCLISPSRDLVLLFPNQRQDQADRTSGCSVLTLEGGHKCLYYAPTSPSPLPVSRQCREVAFIGISHGDLWDMWGKARQKLGDKCWLLGWGFPAPWSHNNLGRTRWVSNLWGLLKKTWLPQSYHPGAAGVFDPLFSSSIACYLIAFQSQGEEMVNGGLCGESLLGLAESQWWVREKTCGLESAPYSGKNTKSMNPLCRLVYLRLVG